MIEIYYRVEYKLLNAWQPTVKTYSSYKEACEDMFRLIELERKSENKVTNTFRILEITNRISSEEIKQVEV